MKEWEFHFDYEALVQPLSEVAGVTLVLRNYHALLQNSVLADFLSVVGLDTAALQNAVALRLNERDTTTVSLNHFYRNRVGRDLTRFEMDAVAHLCRDLPDRIVLTSKLRDALARKFAGSTTAVCHRYGIPTKGLVDEGTTPASGSEVDMQKIFSFETQSFVLEMADLLGTDSDHSNLQSELTRQIKLFTSWVKS